MSKEQSETAFCVVMDFVAKRRQPERIDQFEAEVDASECAARTVANLRLGLSVNEHAASEVYSVYVYSVDARGKTVRLVDQFFVRQKTSAAA